MVTHEDGSVTLTAKEYEDMDDAAAKYNFLRNHGVDNWCGWDDAMQDYHNYKGDDE